MASNTMKQAFGMDTEDGVVVAVDGRTLLAKLCFANKARLAEVDGTIAAVRSKFGDYFGENAAKGELTYAHTGDELQLVADDDVALAAKVAAQPLKITSTVVDAAPASHVAPPADVPEGATVFEHASAELNRFGLEAPPAQLKALLEALELKPRRLVKCGLAPPKALKATEVEEDEEDDGVELVEALSLDEGKEPVAREALAAALADEDANVLAKALKSKGVRLAPACLHTLLRVLRVPPRRFVKLGLVADIHAARQAYKAGGKRAAREFLRSKGLAGGKGACGKGWGRGLHGRGRGGCGRGAAWACHGEKPAKKGCRGKGWSDQEGEHSPPRHHWGPPPHAYWAHGPPPPPHGGHDELRRWARWGADGGGCGKW